VAVIFPVLAAQPVFSATKESVGGLLQGVSTGFGVGSVSSLPPHEKRTIVEKIVKNRIANNKLFFIK